MIEASAGGAAAPIGFRNGANWEGTAIAQGNVKWFNNAKGYGFILPEGGGEDVFAHYSAIQMGGYKALKAGQRVSFEVVRGDKGLHAVNIRPASDEDF